MGAGSGNRTRVFSLEGCCSTIELYPRVKIRVTEWWRELDLNQRRLSPTDLQSVPFNHSGIPPLFCRDQATKLCRSRLLFAGASRCLNLRRVYDGPVSSCQHGASEKVGKIAIKIVSRRFREKTVPREPHRQYKTGMSKDNPGDKNAKDTHYATLRRAHRDGKRERGEIPTPVQDKRKRSAAPDWKAPQLAPDQVLLYGIHTVRAALDNPERKITKLSVTQNALVRLETGPVEELGFPVEIVTPQDLDKILGPDAIHQGCDAGNGPAARAPAFSAPMTAR